MKMITLLLAGSVLGGNVALSAMTLTWDDLTAYYDYASITGSGTGNDTRVTPVVAPAGVSYNPVIQYNKYSATGGFGGGGYVMTQGNAYTPSCENLSSAGISVANGGFAVSFHVRDIGTAGVSFSSLFAGQGVNDATFVITGSSISTPGYGGGWTMADGRNGITAHTDATYANPGSVASEPWQSIVMSVGAGGIVSIYVDGALFATSNAAWNRMTGNLDKLRFGGNGNNGSGATDGQYSDFAIWDKPLTAEDAEWLSNNAVGALVPEPATATLGLLGLTALLIRRRR